MSQKKKRKFPVNFLTGVVRATGMGWFERTRGGDQIGSRRGK